MNRQQIFGHVSRVITNQIGDRYEKSVVNYRKELPPHFLLGSDAISNLKRVDKQREELLEKWREISTSVDFGSGNIPHINLSA